MDFTVKQYSCMEKPRELRDMTGTEFYTKTAVRGQRVCYQIALASREWIDINVSLDSPLASCISLYTVDNAVMDLPVQWDCRDADYITREPGLMPDILTPLRSCVHPIALHNSSALLWVDVKIAQDLAPGVYDIKVMLKAEGGFSKKEYTEVCRCMRITVADAELPAQETLFTQWFHGDCIAQVHKKEIYSEEHWNLIDAYMEMAADLGINMLLTPVLSSSLDVMEGVVRPCTQLLDITKEGGRYTFGFDRLKRWLELCRKHGIHHFEISHLFSQWGLKYSPCIRVREDGVESLAFGWHVRAQDPAYKQFLQQMLPALLGFLEAEGVADSCLFHLSDEPGREHLEAYRYAYHVVKPFIGSHRIIDALSDVAFYESGLVDCPVTAIDHIEPFLQKSIDQQWAYNCCGQNTLVGNRFMSMPAYRNRILGLQMYKYDIKGFLHWGYNFYNSQLSRFQVNPYVTTSAAMAFPSGDPFSVYPGDKGPLASTRGMVFAQGLQDIQLCRMLEAQIGKQAVVELIEKNAGMELTFSQYPRTSDFLPNIAEILAASTMNG